VKRKNSGIVNRGGFLKSFFLLFSALAFSCNISIASDSLLTDDSIFGKLISEDTLRIPDLNHFQIIEPYLFTQIGAQYSESSIVQIRNPNNYEVVWSVIGKCHFYSFSSGKQVSIVFSQAAYEGIASYKVYDIDGELLFSKENPGDFILPSPNSFYYYTQHSEYGLNRFTVFDRKGNALFSRPREPLMSYAVAFNDSVVVLSLNDSLKFISAGSGKTIKTTAAPKERYGRYPRIHALNNGNKLALRFYNTTMYFDSNMNVGWMNSSRFYVNNLSFSDDGRFLATYYSNKDGTFLSLVKSKNGELLWTESLERNYPAGSTPHPALTFTKNFIRLLDPQADYFGEGKLRKSSQTFLYKVDSLSGELLGNITVAGVTLLLADSNYIKSFSVTPDKPFEIIVRKWSETPR